MDASGSRLRPPIIEIKLVQVAVRAELDYIKREEPFSLSQLCSHRQDMLDETGRTKPILIESESKCLAAFFFNRLQEIE